MDHEPERLNPWSTIWSRPRDTMRSIIHTDPKGTILWLAILGGILSGLVFLGNLWLKHPQDTSLRYGLVIFGIILAGAIVGIIHLYFSGWLYQITGNWLGGKGTFTEVKAAVGWTNYPFIFSSILNILSFFLIRSPVAYYIITIINIILVIWGIIIAIKLLAEAHQFSSWRAIGTIILALLLVMAVIMIIVLFIPIFFR